MGSLPNRLYVSFPSSAGVRAPIWPSEPNDGAASGVSWSCWRCWCSLVSQPPPECTVLVHDLLEFEHADWREMEEAVNHGPRDHLDRLITGRVGNFEPSAPVVQVAQMDLSVVVLDPSGIGVTRIEQRPAGIVVRSRGTIGCADEFRNMLSSWGYSQPAKNFSWTWKPRKEDDLWCMRIRLFSHTAAVLLLPDCSLVMYTRLPVITSLNEP